jgi:hypothetical protein
MIFDIFRSDLADLCNFGPNFSFCWQKNDIFTKENKTSRTSNRGLLELHELQSHTRQSGRLRLIEQISYLVLYEATNTWTTEESKEKRDTSTVSDRFGLSNTSQIRWVWQNDQVRAVSITNAPQRIPVHKHSSDSRCTTPTTNTEKWPVTMKEKATELGTREHRTARRRKIG